MKIFKAIVLTSLFFSSFSEAKVLIGIENRGNHFGLTSSETNFFSNERRYGVGHMRLIIGNESGARVQSHGGFKLWKFLGLGMGNFYGELTTKPRDFYMFYPSLDVNIKIKSDKNSLIVGPKAGGTFGNYRTRKFFKPKVEGFVGWQAYLRQDILRIGYDRIGFGDSKLQNFILGVEHGNVRFFLKFSELDKDERTAIIGEWEL